MTAKQGITIASRILTVYFLTLAAYRVTDIPVAMMAFWHYHSSVVSPPDGYVATASGIYYYRVAVEALGHAALIIALTLLMALMFYRCGPRVSRFLLGENLLPEELESNPQQGPSETL